jgi:hypothetical protein
MRLHHGTPPPESYSASEKENPMPSLPRRLSVSLLILGAPLCAALALEHAASSRSGQPVRFFDAPSQAAEFIGYNRSITLTAEQKKVRDKALAAMPAACCDKFSQATCCCPCNMAKSVWGLSNYLIARQNATAPEIQTAVKGWLKFVNARGFTGDVCDTPGGCGQTFSQGGCGGMDERNLLAAR